MFNRVGNLTVLSLRKEINQIIEECCTSSRQGVNQADLNDFSAVRIYWHYFSLSEEIKPRTDEDMIVDTASKS